MTDQFGRIKAKVEEFKARNRGRRTVAEERVEAEAALARFVMEANAGPSVARDEAYAISDQLRKQLEARLGVTNRDTTTLYDPDVMDRLEAEMGKRERAAE